MINEEKKLIEASEVSVPSQSISNADDWLSEILQPKFPSKTESNGISKKSLEKYQSMLTSLKNQSLESIRPEINSFPRKSQTSNEVKVKLEVTEDSEFVFPEYDSDQNDHSDESVVSDDEYDENVDLKLPQILYCSRTHSQIQQYVNEIKQSGYPNIRCISLGSRKNLCINESLTKRFKTDGKLSQECLDLQKNGTKVKRNLENKKIKTENSTKESCIYKNRNLETKFMTNALSQVRDIEELVTLGKKIQTCPYYSTRKAIKYAQIICMPYSLLLHTELRNSMGIKLNGRVIIFDESHNLIESINQLYSAELVVSQLLQILHAISIYLTRYQFILNGKNLYYINVLQLVTNHLKTYLIHLNETIEMNSNSNSNDKKVLIQESNSFIFNAGLDHINVFKLIKYITNTNLVNRIGGYAEHLTNKNLAEMNLIQKNSTQKNCSTSCNDCIKNENEEDNSDTNNSFVQSFRSIVNFLKSLTSANIDGRVIIEKNSNLKLNSITNQILLKFVLFNPSNHFREITESAKSVILLGKLHST